MCPKFIFSSHYSPCNLPIITFIILYAVNLLVVIVVVNATQSHTHTSIHHHLVINTHTITHPKYTLKVDANGTHANHRQLGTATHVTCVYAIQDTTLLTVFSYIMQATTYIPLSLLFCVHFCSFCVYTLCSIFVCVVHNV